MALSNYTGGGFSNYTSYTPSTTLSTYYIPPTPPPRYDREPSYAHLMREERRQREEDNYNLALVRRETIAFDPDGEKRRRRKGLFVKRRQLEGAEGGSQQPVEQVVARCGDTATLPCRAPEPDSVDGLEWTRTDLDGYVYLYKDGEPDLTEQHQAYRGRCELVGGTPALALRNVTDADDGTYECRFVKHDLGVAKRSIIKSEPVSVVRLRVRRSGACKGEEEEEEEEEELIEEEEEEELLPPVAAERHHYVTFGVLGAFGLAVAAILVLVVL